ncbi:MAG: hypothetical protein K2N05_09135 [Muribaculaceae bacterium]|nr:hypothetical protein [Muribaculaceae bacterium]
MKSADVSTPPGMWLALSFDHSFRQSLAAPVIANSEHFWSWVVPPYD